jgi:hypothetical protein
MRHTASGIGEYDDTKIDAINEAAKETCEKITASRSAQIVQNSLSWAISSFFSISE